MGKNILFVFLRLPEKRRDKAVYDLIYLLLKNNNVDVLYSKGMFTKEDELRSLEKSKINLFELKTRRGAENAESQIQSIVMAKKYSLIFFKNCLEAKLYLPYIVKYTPESITVLLLYGISYIFMPITDLTDNYNKIRFIDSKITNKIAVYNFFDCLLTNNKSFAGFLNSLMPEAAVKVIEDSSDKPLTMKTVDGIKKKKKREKAKAVVKIIKTGKEVCFDESAIDGDIAKAGSLSYVDNEENLVNSYNNAMTCDRADYIFICTADTILTATAFEKMIFCIDSSPFFGIVAPMSVLYEEGTNLGERYKKHIGDNYANWYVRGDINEFCFVIKRDVVEKAGKFDEKFNTVWFAQIDLCWRALEEGFFTVVAGDALAHYVNDNKINIKDKKFKEDYQYLQTKWKNRNPALLKRFKTEYQEKIR